MLPGSPSPGWVPTLPVADPPPLPELLTVPDVLDALEPDDDDALPLDPVLPDAPPVDPDPEPLLDAELEAAAWRTTAQTGAVGMRATEAWRSARERRTMGRP
jgi:hypothetical protein